MPSPFSNNMSENIIVITSFSNATLNGLPGAVCDLISNHPAAAADIQRAAVAYEATLKAGAASASKLQSSLDSLMLAFNAATTEEQRAPIIAQANALTTSGQLKLLQDAAAKHQADLTAAQTKIAALAPQPTPMPTPAPSA